METIFDHNLTEEELDHFFASEEEYKTEPYGIIAYSHSLRKKENYMRHIIDGAPNTDATHDAAMNNLFSLFWMREGKDKAREYAYKIKDPQYRMDKLNLLGGF